MVDEIIFKDENRIIKITETVIKTMKKYLQIMTYQPESGGILIGRENDTDNNLIVEYATSPMFDDIQKRNRYIRKDRKHVHFYQQLYKENNGIYRYIGEWHTHPESFPDYSSIDSENWKKIAKEDPYKQIYYHLILGTKTIRVWKIKYPEILTPEMIYPANW